MRIFIVALCTAVCVVSAQTPIQRPSAVAGFELDEITIAQLEALMRLVTTPDKELLVAGRVGALPPTVPVRVFATDLDTGAKRSLLTNVADESGVEEALPVTAARDGDGA